MLAKITSKNQLTLPKSVTEALGPVQYFEVQAKAGQIVLTPVRIQRGDAVRAKLAELAIDEKTLEQALGWAEQGAEKSPRAKNAASKPLSTAAAPKKPAKQKIVRTAVKTIESKKVVKPARAARAEKIIETAVAKTRKGPALKTLSRGKTRGASAARKAVRA